MRDYIYLDNAAAMRADPEIVKRFSIYSEEYFPNPEAEHAAGRDCRKEVAMAAERLSLALTDDNDYNVFWTNSATEAMNLVFSFSEMFKGSLVTSISEHPSFEKPLSKLKDCELRKVNIKSDGTFDLADLEKKLDKTVSVVALHHVQNETGAVQDLCAVRELINSKAPNAILIADTVQAIGKIDIPWHKADINIAFIGGHKLGLLTGGAIIYRMPDKKQNDIFSKHLTALRNPEHIVGRVDPPIAITLADAVEITEREKKTHFDKITYLNSLLRKNLLDSDIDVKFLLSDKISSPYIASLLLLPYQGQVLVRMLSEKGVMVSEGSACEAASKEPSTALRAMGISVKDAFSVLRISFGFQSDESDVNAFIVTLKEVLEDY